ncbi:MAG: nucleotide exchange factor GrpE, partial [Actinomycetota bacterium]|nr:nucleotide exchange factor GrpE [Actinomycetota bacterium]
MSDVEKQEKTQQRSKTKSSGSTSGRSEVGKENIHAARSHTESKNGNQAEIEEMPTPEESAKSKALSEREEELKRENEKLMDAFLRLKADFENYRKRMIREQTRIVETAEAGLVKKLLPVLDNLERAMLNADDKRKNTDSALLDGVKMIYGQFLDVLEKEGLEIINPQGEPFDPEEHEAM